MLLRTTAVLALSLAACTCSPSGDEPDEESSSKVGDVLGALPAKGSVKDVERAALMIQAISTNLGWGTVAADDLRKRAGEPILLRSIALLSDGGDQQIHAAWSDFRQTWLDSYVLSVESKAGIRRSDARLENLKHRGVAGKELLHAELVELAWLMTVVAKERALAGK